MKFTFTNNVKLSTLPNETIPNILKIIAKFGKNSKITHSNLSLKNLVKLVPSETDINKFDSMLATFMLLLQLPVSMQYT